MILYLSLHKFLDIKLIAYFVSLSLHPAYIVYYATLKIVFKGVVKAQVGGGKRRSGVVVSTRDQLTRKVA